MFVFDEEGGEYWVMKKINVIIKQLYKSNSKKMSALVTLDTQTPNFNTNLQSTTTSHIITTQ